MPTVSLSEAARLYGRHPRTMQRWLEEGKLHGTQVTTNSGYQWRIDVPDEIALRTVAQESPADTRGDPAGLAEILQSIDQRLARIESRIASRDYLTEPSNPTLLLDGPVEASKEPDQTAGPLRRFAQWFFATPAR